MRIKLSSVAFAQFPQTLAGSRNVLVGVGGILYQLRQVAQISAFPNQFFGKGERTIGLKIRHGGYSLDVRITVVSAGGKLAPNAIQQAAIAWLPVGEAPI